MGVYNTTSSEVIAKEEENNERGKILHRAEHVGAISQRDKRSHTCSLMT